MGKKCRLLSVEPLQVAVRPERRLGAIADDGNNLLLGDVGNVAGGEEIRQSCLPGVVDRYLFLLIERQQVLDRVGVGYQPDLDEDAGDVEPFRLATLRIPLISIPSTIGSPSIFTVACSR